MSYPWIAPVPKNAEVLNARFWGGRLQLEVDGALTHHAKAAVGRRFAGLGNVYVESTARLRRACLGHFERDQPVHVSLREPLDEREVIDGWTAEAVRQRDIWTEIGPSGAVRAVEGSPPIVWGAAFTSPGAGLADEGSARQPTE